MKEKFNEYPIGHPLTAARRQKIDRFIQNNASRLDRPLSHRWDKSGKVLFLASSPVEWEFVFHPDRVEAFGSAPLWVRLLFTEKRKKVANEVILQMLQEGGLVAPPAALPGKKEAPAAPRRPRKKSPSR